MKKDQKKLLLKRKELTKLQSKVQEQGLTLIPLKVYQSSSEKHLHSCRRWKLDFNYILSLRLYNT